MTIAIISHPDCIQHSAGEGHPEQPNRVRVIQQAIENFSFATPVQYHLASLATPEQLIATHTKKYVDWIYSVAPKEGFLALDADTILNAHSLTAALRAAGSLPQAVDLILQDAAKTVFCNVRPPGHHAEKDKAMGFCLFNNVAVGVSYALQQGIERILIVDFDVHHGNGTQNIFQDNNRVMLCSSFEHPLYPGYDPAFDNDHILNLPLAAGTTGKIYREKVQAAWFDRINQFKPELIFFSAGFDGHARDPLADLKLEKEDYVWITEQIASIAQTHCAGRLISALEGGYNLDVLADCVPAHIAAMQP